MRRLIWIISILLLMSAGVGCTNIYTPTPSMATATLPPLATFTPRYTATPVPSVTPRPTLTETPSITPVPPTASSTPTLTPTPPVFGRVSSVQDAVNMREGPGVTFAAIQGVTNNSDIIILAASEDQTWYNIRLDDGTEGWIAANLIYVLPSPTPIPTNTAPGVVVEVSGTPLATALLGGEPITATPSSTPSGNTDALAASPIPRTPGTVTATLSPTPTSPIAANIPTITPTRELDLTTSPTPSGASSVLPTVSGSVVGPFQRYDVLAYCTDYDEVPPPLAEGTTIDIFWGWIASTEDYVRQHMANVIYEVELDGVLLENWRLFADDVRQIATGDWSIYWYVPIEEPLSVGVHTITYRVSWRNPIFDGTSEFGPGKETEFEAGSCTFEIR